MSTHIPTIKSSKSDNGTQRLVISGHRVMTNGRYGILGTHGVGTVVGERLITNPEDLAAALSGYEEDPDALGSSIRGSLTIYVEDLRTGSIHVLSDPFGSSIVFYWQGKNDFYASSSLGHLVSVLSDAGFKPKKSLAYAALLASSNNGGLSESPYEGIRVIEQFSFLTFSTDGVIVEDYSMSKNLFLKINRTDSGRNALRELAVTDIINNVKAASRFEAPEFICHLTGGMDSRTVLAALIASGYQDKYSLHCGGDPLSDDMTISRKLSYSLNTSISRNSGLNHGIIPGSPAEDSRWAMHETHGVLRGPANPGLHRSNSVVLSGGFGGLLRNSFGAALSSAPVGGFSGLDVLDPMLGALGKSSIASNSVLSKELIDYSRSIINEKTLEAEEKGIPNDALPEFLWFAFRSRYYVGEISRSLSKYVNRFDPLYTPWLLPLAWSYSREMRGNNFAHLDLICDLSEELGMTPYDKKRITDQYLSERPRRQIRDLQNKMAPLISGNVRLNPVTPGKNQSGITKEQLAEARRVGLPPATVAYSEYYRKQSRHLADEIGESELSNYFNYEALIKLLENPPKWRPQYRSIRDLHDVLSWYTA